MDRGELVLASATIQRAGKPVMVTARAPGDFKSADALPEGRAKIDNQTRLICAVLDFLTYQMDRHQRNFMVNPKGAVRLIDHDFSLGHLHPSGSYFGKDFYAGEATGYVGDDALPPKAAAVVARLSSMSVTEISKQYGLDGGEARVLSQRAKLVATFGLSTAINLDLSGRIPEVASRLAA
jgi:hypothetical protein